MIPCVEQNCYFITHTKKSKKYTATIFEAKVNYTKADVWTRNHERFLFFLKKLNFNFNFEN